ncbi:MAG: response regulator [Gammaproteobacteria bacterium]|nr:response regulator [Gammaproteobacteria bacterium]
MSDQIAVLLVDDEKEVRDYLALYLEKGGCEVIVADNGVEALKKLEENCEKISIIVTDIVMPQLDGLELCAQVKRDKRFSSIPVVFVSQLETLEEKIAGYEAGAEDYFTKPVEVETLVPKIKILVEFSHRNQMLEEKLRNSNSMTQSLMSYYGDMGYVISYYDTCMASNSFAGLANALFEILKQINLSGALVFFLPEGKSMSYSTNGECPPLEKKLLEQAHGSKRFMDFGSRTIVNHTHFSLLIKNMPVENQERYGVLKDTLGSLCNATDVRTNMLVNDMIQLRKNEIVDTVKNSLEGINSAVKVTQKMNVESVNRLMAQIEKRFMTLGLSEDQEDEIRDVVEACRKEIEEAFEQAREIGNEFSQVNDRLNNIMDKRSA